ncbi:MAG: response regulator [Alphaproteobacteria bacterium]|nr:response regulator [Alphaproteobacteria bacterium]
MLSSTHCMKRKILIVEDDPVHQSHLARLVTRLGHEPVAFASGQEALDAIMKRRDPAIAAILLDLVMPDLDGMGVITRLHAAGYRTPIIVLVKPTALDSALAAIAAGAQDFCLIPAGFERIAVSLKNMLAPSEMSLKDMSATQTSIIPLSASKPLSFRDPLLGLGKEPQHHDVFSASIPLIDHDGELRSLASIEKDVIAFAIKNNTQPFAAIARALGISRSTLYRRIEEITQNEFKISPPAYGDAA